MKYAVGEEHNRMKMDIRGKPSVTQNPSIHHTFSIHYRFLRILCLSNYFLIAVSPRLTVYIRKVTAHCFNINQHLFYLFQCFQLLEATNVQLVLLSSAVCSHTSSKICFSTVTFEKVCHSSQLFPFVSLYCFNFK